MLDGPAGTALGHHGVTAPAPLLPRGGGELSSCGVLGHSREGKCFCAWVGLHLCDACCKAMARAQTVLRCFCLPLHAAEDTKSHKLHQQILARLSDTLVLGFAPRSDQSETHSSCTCSYRVSVPSREPSGPRCDRHTTPGKASRTFLTAPALPLCCDADLTTAVPLGRREPQSAPAAPRRLSAPRCHPGPFQQAAPGQSCRLRQAQSTEEAQQGASGRWDG